MLTISTCACLHLESHEAQASTLVGMSARVQLAALDGSSLPTSTRRRLLTHQAAPQTTSHIIEIVVDEVRSRRSRAGGPWVRTPVSVALSDRMSKHPFYFVQTADGIVRR